MPEGECFEMRDREGGRENDLMVMFIDRARIP